MIHLNARFTDNGVGEHKIAFTISMDNANYAVTIGVRYGLIADR